MINSNAAIRYGNQALIDFQNLMVEKFGDNYQLTLSDLKNKLIAKNPDFLIELGNAVYKSGFGQRRVNESMERVVAKISSADENIGIMNFTNGIVEEASSFDFSLLGDVALSIGKDAQEAGEEISKGFLGFFKNWGQIIPILFVSGLALFFITKSKVYKKVLG